MNKLKLVVILVLLSTISGSGQKIVPSPEDLYDDALEYMLAGDYIEALYPLKSLEDKGYNTANIQYKIGECYLNIPGQKKNALPYMQDAVQKISVNYSGNTLQEEYAPVKSLLYLGIAYRLNNDLTKAQESLNSYLSAVDDADLDNRKLAEYHIERCNNARELIAAPAIYSADTLPGIINSMVSNFNPLVSPDEKEIYYMNQLKFYDAVMHSVKNDTSWQAPENLTPNIKSDGDHYITGMSADGTRIFLTLYDPYRSGEIYASEFKNGIWSALSRLNDNVNTQFNETHASPSPDGKYLYLTSDRKGGFGGLDIYRSEMMPTGEYGPPVNLGPLINTPYNEESPFLSSDTKQLFFSSQGHYNMGGYDVFVSALGADANWLPPVNIGSPLNTTDDDLFFFPAGTGKVAYQSHFSSSTGRQDILRYTIISFGNPARFTLHGRVNLLSGPDYSPDNLSVSFIDANSMDTLSVQQLLPDGSFTQKLPGGMYRLIFNEKTRLLLTKELSIPEYFPHNELVMNVDIEVPGQIVIDSLFVRDIRFAFDKSVIDEKYHDYLDELAETMKKYPALTLQINGYADSKGRENYNLELSHARARIVQDYLTSRVPLAERISANGYGEKNPVAINTNIDGTDNPQGRSYNRRVELLINGCPAELILIMDRDIPESLLWTNNEGD